METIATTYAKAVDELSGKIFIPGLISSLFVELGPLFIQQFEFNFWRTYLALAFFGLLLTPLLLVSITQISIWFFEGRHIGDVIGLLIMPLGFAGIFPQLFSGIDIPYKQVTGMAILAWSFMLVRDSVFLNRLKELT